MSFITVQERGQGEVIGEARGDGEPTEALISHVIGKQHPAPGREFAGACAGGGCRGNGQWVSSFLLHGGMG